MKSFSQWTIEEVEDQFQLNLVKGHPLLKNWLEIEEKLSPDHEKRLMDLSEMLENNVWSWNEMELKMLFIGPLLHFVNFEHKFFHPFMEREISVTFEEETLSGIVDFVVAQGRRSPKAPYFFLNEYKKEHDSSNDPFGQLVIAMVAAQKANQNKNPLYGAYVIGRDWYFTVLQGNDYSVTPGHNAAKEEIKDIYCILKRAKILIEQLIQT